jgi:hypothetical protein
MRNPEEIKAEYPASNISRVHQTFVKEYPDKQLAERAGHHRRNRHVFSKWAWFFTDKKSGNGWVLILTRYHHKVFASGKISKWAENVYVYFNATPNGIRVMSRSSKRKAWGFTGVRTMIHETDKFDNFVKNNFKVSDFVPQAKYLTKDEFDDFLDYGSDDFWDLVSLDPHTHKLIGNQPGIKGTMNEIFKGNRHGVPKDIFNGNLNKSMTLGDLIHYTYIARAFSGYGDRAADWLRGMNVDVATLDRWCLIAICKYARSYAKFFNYSEHSYNKLRDIFDQWFIEHEEPNPELFGPSPCCNTRHQLAETMRMLLPETFGHLWHQSLNRQQRKEIRNWYHGTRGITELHDHLAFLDRQRRGVREQLPRAREEDRSGYYNIADKEPDFSELSKFDGNVGSNITCVTPRSQDDMLMWGQETSTCIATYWYYVMMGYSFCMVFKRDGAIIALAEVRSNMELSQLLGKYNQNLDTDTLNIILPYLEGKDVNTSGYWIGR